jgi:hypothetical protein
VITSEALQSFISSIPPLPEQLTLTLKYLDEGDLVKAGQAAADDLALSTYLRTFVNRPIFFLRQEVKDVSQIFGILGLAKAKELLYHYMMHLFSPKRWELFDLNEHSFSSLQVTLSSIWKNILDAENIKNTSIIEIIALVPASIIVTELIFSSHIKEVQILREAKQMDYNTILERLVGVNLFDLAEMIGQTWGMEEKSLKVLKASSGLKKCGDSQLYDCARYMHLMLFYVLSQPEFLECGLNDFLDFNPEFVMPVMEKFQNITSESDES